MPEDFDACPSGTHKALDENALQIADLEDRIADLEDALYLAFIEQGCRHDESKDYVLMAVGSQEGRDLMAASAKS